jgi:hypothetical protein
MCLRLTEVGTQTLADTKLSENYKDLLIASTIV